MIVLVAGDGGYVGAVMVPFLRAAGHEIDGLDPGVYEGCDLGPAPTDASAQIPADVTDVAAEQLTSYDLCNAIAYGFSSRLRPDIVVSNLTGLATTTGQVRLESDGTRWRPLVHLGHISWAFLAVLEAKRELVRNVAFNIGAHDNVQVRDVAEMVRDAVLHSKASLAYIAGPDLRNYRVDFSTLEENFPELSLRWSGGGNRTAHRRLHQARTDL